MGDVEDLKAELAALKAELDNITKAKKDDDVHKELASMKVEIDKVAKAKKEAEQKVVFTPKQRKLDKFSGRSGEAYANVYEFCDEIHRILKSRPTPPEEQVDFVIGHLEGPAKEEVRYRSAKEKSTPFKVLEILRESFGERATTSELMADFYQTGQAPSQTLQDFSHQLMKKLDKVMRVDDSFISDKDKLLRNQFSENVADTWLKRELKKIIRGHPLVTFSDIREESLVLAQDRDEDNQPIRKKKEVPIYSETASNDLSKLVGELRKEMAEMRIEMKEIRNERATPAPKTERTCYLCKEKGHIKRNCPLNEKNLSSGAGR